MPTGDQVVRINQQNASAGANQTLSLTAGNDPTTGAYFGKRLRPILFTAKYDASVTGVTVSVTLNSGLGATYDTLLKTETFTGTDYAWGIQDELPGFMILPLQDAASSGTKADALDFLVSGQGSVNSYATIYFEIF